MTATHNHYASASLYVGDLAPEVNETVLFEIFNNIGAVASIRVCRESGTRKSLGYAYVNYHSVQDAERALDTLNFTSIKGTPCRIMWSHRDPSLRKSGNGNVFIKNLDRSIDNKSLYDTFSLFGTILSCKVATDEFGKSRGYGFIHYETEEAALLSIEKVNGMLIGSKNVYVGQFKKRFERTDTRLENFTNLYVKNFPEEWNEDILKSVFETFGTITSQTISVDAKGRKFGFVNFEDAVSAKAAVEALHGKKTAPTGISEDQSDVARVGNAEVTSQEEKKNESCNEEIKDNDDKKASEETKDEAEKKTDADEGGRSPCSEVDDGRLYVQRAMTKSERISVLKDSFNTTQEAKQKEQGVNLYVKNLDDQVSDEDLREAFSRFGTVTSAKIMRDEADISKGFGFVCFAFPEDATKAVTAMHLKIFHKKPLYVGLAEKRGHRIARLQQRYRMSNARAPNSTLPQQQMMMPNNMMQSPMMQSYGNNPQMFFGGPPMQQRPMPTGPGGYGVGNSMGMGWRQGARPYATQQAGAPGNMGLNQVTPAYPYPIGAVGPMNPTGSIRGPRPRVPSAGLPSGSSVGAAGNFKFTPQARNRQDFAPHMAQIQHMGHELATAPSTAGSTDAPLSAQSLAAAHPQMQKQMLGEKLFPLVAKHQSELAGKITGMMLEMDNAELLSLLESDSQLKAKVDEAVGVLRRHQQAPNVAAPASVAH